MKTNRTTGRSSVLTLWGDRTSSGANTIPDLLEQTARRLPHKVAFQVKDGSEFRTLTYAGLQRRAADFGAPSSPSACSRETGSRSSARTGSSG
jgi:hypothetical protein